MLKSYLKRKALDVFFNPKLVAVVGASEILEKIGGFIFQNLLKMEEVEVFPVNKKCEFVQGVKAYCSLDEIHRKVQVVVIAIPSQFVLDVVACGIHLGIKNYVIISAGFGESDLEGKNREKMLKEMIHQHNLNVIGPNCLGILNPYYNLNSSFCKNLPLRGDVALISQSGALIDAIVDKSFEYNIGFSKIASLGNMVDLDEVDFLNYLENDSETKKIVFYIEEIKRGKLFADAILRVSKKKPVVILTSGKTKQSQKAIVSHTGSLAQNPVLVESLLKMSNCILVNNLTETFDVLVALQPLKISKNSEIAILTNAGGLGAVSSDTLKFTNFKLSALTSSQQSQFSGLPDSCSLANPVDILGDAKKSRYLLALKTLESFSNVSYVLVIITPQMMTDIFEISKMLVEFSKKSKKIIFSSFVGEREVKMSVDFLKKNSFPNFETPSRSLLAFSKLLKYKQFSYSEKPKSFSFDKKKVQELTESVLTQKGVLSYSLSKKILEIFSISLPLKKIIAREEDIGSVEVEKNKKYVLKADGNNLVHKKDMGLVVEDVTCENFGSVAKSLLSKSKKLSPNSCVTLEEQVCGYEAALGFLHDENLGDFVLFGTGGTYISLYKDFSFSPAPLTKMNAKKLIERTKMYEILKGYRGGFPVNLDLVLDLLVKLSYVRVAFPCIKEIDLNPVICMENSIYLADVKIIV